MVDKKELIGILAQNEELLSRLYKIYAQKIDNYSDFWYRLSDDERMHADKVRIFGDSEEVKINLAGIKKTDLSSFAKEIEEATKETEEKEANLNTALKKALAFENNLIEKEFFGVFSTDSSEMKFYLEEMKESIDNHRKRIEKMIERSK